jgi:integrase/recombinase XerC
VKVTKAEDLGDLYERRRRPGAIARRRSYFEVEWERSLPTAATVISPTRTETRGMRVMTAARKRRYEALPDLQILRAEQTESRDYFILFLQSREVKEVSAGSLKFYRTKLGRFLKELNPDLTDRQEIERFLLQFSNPGNRHAYYRVIKTFFNWREQSFSIPSPMKHISAPRLGKLILPSLDREQVIVLLKSTPSVRNKAIITLFTESGLRLSELTHIEPDDINWERRVIQVVGKGKKEGFAPFGELTEKYITAWLAQYQPDGNIWGLNEWGITSMLRRLEESTGIKCNPHVFRRTFACLLRKAGIDTMTIKDLGRWESLEMVQRYTRSVGFNDSFKFYKAPLS